MGAAPISHFPRRHKGEEPLILRPLLINPEDNDDTLNLSIELRKTLAAASYATARGGAEDVEAVFVDTDDLPGAVRVTGTYTVRNGPIHVSLTLKRNGLKSAPVEVAGADQDPPGLAGKILQAILKSVEEQK